jgi:hypothetical protein
MKEEKGRECDKAREGGIEQAKRMRAVGILGREAPAAGTMKSSRQPLYQLLSSTCKIWGWRRPSQKTCHCD